MVLTSHPNPTPSKDLCNYLENHIGLTPEALKLGLRQSLVENAPLPIVLWSFGLITQAQLDNVLKWQNEN